MKILIIGGTGFIGYHTVHECLRRGHTLSVLALPSPFNNHLFPAEVKTIQTNLNRMQDDRLMQVLSEHDVFVFAAGADDRTLPRAPSYPFFENGNVKPAVRIVSLASQAGMKKGIILSSYFAHFHRLWPEKELAKHHPYIRSRIEQEKQAFAAASGEFSVIVVELPYIFGSMPYRLPLWAPLIRYIRSPLPLFCTEGGTNMISVQHVAEAIAGAAEHGDAGRTYLVGDENVEWTDFFNRLCAHIERRKSPRVVSNRSVKRILKIVSLSHKIMRREGGLDPVRFVDIQTARTYFDPESSRKQLKYGRGGLDEAFGDTVRACLGYK